MPAIPASQNREIGTLSIHTDNVHRQGCLHVWGVSVLRTLYRHPPNRVGTDNVFSNRPTTYLATERQKHDPIRTPPTEAENLKLKLENETKTKIYSKQEIPKWISEQK